MISRFLAFVLCQFMLIIVLCLFLWLIRLILVASSATIRVWSTLWHWRWAKVYCPGYSCLLGAGTKSLDQCEESTLCGCVGGRQKESVTMNSSAPLSILLLSFYEDTVHPDSQLHCGLFFLSGRKLRNAWKTGQSIPVRITSVSALCICFGGKNAKKKKKKRRTCSTCACETNAYDSRKSSKPHTVHASFPDSCNDTCITSIRSQFLSAI